MVCTPWTALYLEQRLELQHAFGWHQFARRQDGVQVVTAL